MDILIPLGQGGSAWYENELRFTLRSIEKYLTNVDRIFIVGHKPRIFTNVEEIKCPDFGKTKMHRILHKITFAIKNSDISEEFLFMNDDHYLQKKSAADKYPNYYDMPLKEAIDIPRRSSIYAQFIQNTFEAFPYGLHYDIHCPIRYNKKLFLEAMNQVDWNKKAYVIKSVYGNAVRIKGKQMTDCNLYDNEHFESKIAGRPFFSSSEHQNYSKLGRLLKTLYPEPCKYEAITVSL